MYAYNTMLHILYQNLDQCFLPVTDVPSSSNPSFLSNARANSFLNFTVAGIWLLPLQTASGVFRYQASQVAELL